MAFLAKAPKFFHSLLQIVISIVTIMSHKPGVDFCLSYFAIAVIAQYDQS